MSPAHWLYRPEQFRKALYERRRPVSPAFVAHWLDPRARPLFWAMSGRDRAHSAATAALLANDATARPELVAAALLHDCGKVQQTIWQRVLYV
ncbi:MAG TPA: hypothetical protein VFO27_16220, partial [Bryobacteraceae bacterium]|nr:hypothetical protein [Bryobacteraceae bacterium]